MLALLVYGYANQVLSSRRIEALCAVDVAFRVICAGDAPDHATLARFRRKNLAAFEDLFAQVLVLCAKAGMARLGMSCAISSERRGTVSWRNEEDRVFLTR